jgi:ribosomal protein S18 acetylase RimI-like enzyme
VTAFGVRPMTREEFSRWQRASAEEFARHQVAAGTWAADDALERALASNSATLPAGIDTERMFFLRAVVDEQPVGHAWIGLDHPRGAVDCAFLYDIEIDEPWRGRGYGRMLLAAVEEAVREAGIPSLELNVHGGNGTAISLYGSAGYTVVTQQMRKAL